MKGKVRKQEAVGLKIGKPRIKSSGRHLVARFFSCLILTALGSFGAFGCFYSGFSFGFSMGCAAAAIAVTAFLFSLLFFSGKHRAIFALAVCLLFLWAAFFLIIYELYMRI